MFTPKHFQDSAQNISSAGITCALVGYPHIVNTEEKDQTETHVIIPAGHRIFWGRFDL